MASRGIISRSTRNLWRSGSCAWCQSRLNCISAPALLRCSPTASQASGGRMVNNSQSYAISSAGTQDAKKMRHNIDKKRRLAWYTLSHQEKALRIQPHTADAIYEDFLAHRSKYSNVNNVKRIAEKYKINLEDLAGLGIVTFKISDVKDPAKKAMLPPSLHKSTAALILQGCAEAEEPLAVVQCMTAVYLSALTGGAIFHELSSQFIQRDVKMFREVLVKLCQRSKEIELGPDALTLQGLLLESEGKAQQAKECYAEAIERSHLEFKPGSRHPGQFPLMAPWNALAYLYKKNPDPDAQARAKANFELGAEKADDPLSYYELAAFEDRLSAKWIKCISRAAASGHQQAMAEAAKFYGDVLPSDSPARSSTELSPVLNWLFKWARKDDGAEMKLYSKWLEVAAELGHKPSALQLADLSAQRGDGDSEKEYLRMIAKPLTGNVSNKAEEWPQLVQLAKQRLAGIKK